jgi:hypothetical protein
MNTAMNVVVAHLSWLIAGVGIVLGGLTLAIFRRPPMALHLLLDFLLAAGLLRLSTDASWQVLAITATVVVVRRLVTVGLTHPAARHLYRRRLSSARGS